MICNHNFKKNPRRVLQTSVRNNISIDKVTTDEEWSEIEKSWKEKYGDLSTRRFTSHCPIEIQERIRNMCFYGRISISDVFVYGLILVLEEFERDFNSGTPWGQRPKEVAQGRPLEK